MGAKRVVFFGTPDYAVPSLRALAAAHDVALVVTGPDRVRGRGRRKTPSPVKRAALELGLDVAAPEDANAADLVARVRGAAADALAVIAYGRILSERLLAAAPLGGVNAHGSLLPRWRGAAPIARAILAGDRETGVSMMRMVKKMDAGPVLAARALPIGAKESAGSLHDRSAELSAEMFPATLSDLEKMEGEPQDESRVTLAPKIGKQELRLDWTRDAAALARQVRAFSPAPGAWTRLADGRRLKVLEAQEASGGGEAPGTLRRAGDALFLSAAVGLLRLVTVQPEGRRAMDAAEFLRGYEIPGRL